MPDREGQGDMTERRRLMIEGPDGLYWHNAHGWVPAVITETFSPNAQGRLNLPMQGRWVAIWEGV